MAQSGKRKPYLLPACQGTGNSGKPPALAGALGCVSATKQGWVPVAEPSSSTSQTFRMCQEDVVVCLAFPAQLGRRLLVLNY
jgi:hypothetical protein